MNVSIERVQSYKYQRANKNNSTCSFIVVFFVCFVLFICFFYNRRRYRYCRVSNVSFHAKVSEVLDIVSPVGNFSIFFLLVTPGYFIRFHACVILLFEFQSHRSNYCRLSSFNKIPVDLAKENQRITFSFLGQTVFCEYFSKVVLYWLRKLLAEFLAA